MSLAEYLAKNYLTADNPSGTTDLSTRPKKKRKKTKPQDVEPSGLIIADDDESLSIRSSSYNQSRSGRHDPDDDNPLTVTGPNPSAEFKRSKKSAWKRVGGSPLRKDAEQAEADAILASAAAEASAKAKADEGEDAPAMVSGGEEEEGGDVDDDGGLRMESGAKAGLQTAAQTAEMVKAMEKKKKREAAKNKEKGRGEEETIYRDASGRIINVAMKRAEARRIADEEAAKEAAAKEALKGDVQRREAEKRKEQLEEAKVLPLARGVDDEELNEKLKARERWNDPAAEFLTSTKTSAAAAAGGASRSSASLKPVYKGAAPPNRYGIKPGYRWDGVDRGNGFESEWFAARNKKERIGALEYAWQMDE